MGATDISKLTTLEMQSTQYLGCHPLPRATPIGFIGYPTAQTTSAAVKKKTLTYGPLPTISLCQGVRGHTRGLARTEATAGAGKPRSTMYSHSSSGQGRDRSFHTPRETYTTRNQLGNPKTAPPYPEIVGGGFFTPCGLGAPTS